MSSDVLDYLVVTNRAQAGYEVERKHFQPLGDAYFKASTSALGIAIACASEAFALTVALHAQFPVLSDGTDLGSEMLSLRWSMVAGLMLGHVVLHDSANQTRQTAQPLLRRLQIFPVMAVVGGIAVFQFTTAQAAAGGDGQGGLAGSAIGCVLGGLFFISFVASNKLAGVLVPAMRTILSELAQRAQVAQIGRDLEAADQCQANIAALKRDIADREVKLRQRTAEEAAMVVGLVAADAHDHHVSREAVGDDIRPEDTVDLPDTPLAALDKRQAYLKTLTVEFFRNLLDRKEA